jgi:hypothetical protein
MARALRACAVLTAKAAGHAIDCDAPWSRETLKSARWGCERRAPASIARGLSSASRQKRAVRAGMSAMVHGSGRRGYFAIAMSGRWSAMMVEQF